MIILDYRVSVDLVASIDKEQQAQSRSTYHVQKTTNTTENNTRTTGNYGLQDLSTQLLRISWLLKATDSSPCFLMNRTLGVEHPDTILAMGNLASSYRALGKHTEVEKVKIQILDLRKRILGVEHPDTILAMANLAVTYSTLGKYTEAEKLEVQALDARKRILGVQHPNNIQAMDNLAATLRSLGQYKEAETEELQY